MNDPQRLVQGLRPTAGKAALLATPVYNEASTSECKPSPAACLQRCGLAGLQSCQKAKAAVGELPGNIAHR